MAGFALVFHYPMKEMKKVGKVLKMEDVLILAFSVLVGNEYVQNAGAGWGQNGGLVQRYHRFVIPRVCSLKDAVAFLYGHSLGVRERLASGYTAGKDYVKDKHVKSNGQVIESGSEAEKPLQPGDDHGAASMSMEDDDGGNENSSMGGLEMGSQSSIITED